MEEAVDTAWLVCYPEESVKNAWNRLQRQLRHDHEEAVGPVRLADHPLMLFVPVRHIDEEDQG